MNSILLTGYERLATIAAGRIDEACDRFERAWRVGPRPAIENHLDDTTGPERPILIRELILMDAQYRRRAGEEPRAEDYADRFPDLDDAWLARVLAPPAPTVIRPVTPPPAGALPEVPGYQVLGELGRGGMGVVYKARQIKLDRLVAVKMILTGPWTTESDLARFQAEAEAVARLHHPNIVQIFEVGEHAGRPFFSMEFVDGGGLDRRLAGAPMPPLEAARLIATLSETVHVAHERGIVHCDLKPANILLSGGRDQGSGVSTAATLTPYSWLLTPKVTDFGLARWLGKETGLTKTGVIIGTPSYMAPEQACGQVRTIGPATDVYALGAVLYETLTGRPPFLATTAVDTLEQVRHQEPVSVTRLQPQVPRDLGTICMKCLQKEPHKRYPTAAALAEDVRRFLAHEPIQARRVGTVERAWRWCRRKPVVAGLAAAVAGLLLVIVTGAPLAAIRLRHERDQAQVAEQNALERLRESYVAQAAVVRADPQAGRRRASLDLLDRAADIRRGPDLRDEVIASLTLTDLDRARVWSGNPVTAGQIDFDPALEHYARHDDRGDVSVRRVADDTELARLPTPIASRRPVVLVFSPDGRWLAASYSVNPVQFRFVVWDWRAGRPRLDLPAAWVGGGPLFDSKNRRVAVSLPGHAVGIYDLETGKEVKRFDGLPELEWMAFDPAGGRLAVSSARDRVVEIRDLDSGEVSARLTYPAGVRGLSWAPDGTLLAAGVDDHHVHVWNVATRQPHAVLHGHGEAVLNVAFSSNGDLLFSADSEGKSRLWDAHTGRPLVTDAGFALRFRSDDGAIAFLDAGKVGVWEIRRGGCRLLHATPAPDKHAELYWPTSIDFSPDGRLLAVAGGYGVRLWDVATGREVAALASGQTDCVRYHPDGRGLFTLSNGTVQLLPIGLDARGGPQVGRPQSLAKVDDPFRDSAMSGDGHWLAVADPAKSRALVVCFDQPDQPAATFAHAGIGGVALSRDGRWLATTSEEEGAAVRIWDRAAGREVAGVPGGRGRVRPAFSPDGRSLVIGNGTEYRLLEVGTWRLVQTMARDQPGAESAAQALAADGSVLAVAATDQKVRLIEVSTGTHLANLPAVDSHTIRALCFSADRSYLAVATNSPTVQLWDLGRLRRELAVRDLDWRP
ncbi:MAG TPA: serine/threonine-protein kinase [Gemmataceae bacterium]|nr:serine/threonine-protein kinase [Gemmataceae bacterium]